MAVDKKELLQEIDEAIANIYYTSPYQNDIPAMVSGMERVQSIVEDAFDEDENCTCATCGLGKGPMRTQGVRGMCWCKRTHQYEAPTHFCAAWVSEAPPIDHWIYHPPFEAFPGEIVTIKECPICYNWTAKKLNHCPNCGTLLKHPIKEEEKCL